jgi:leucyl aminopeptidase
MHASATTDTPSASGADTIAVGVFEDADPAKRVAHDLPGGELAALLDAGEARASFRHLALTHHDGRRWLLAGLGPRAAFDAERARVVAATVLGRARELGAATLCWELPHHVSDDVCGGFVEGTLLAAYRFDRYRSAPPADRGPGRLVISAHHDVDEPVRRAAILAAHVNRARDLVNMPANDLTPQALAAWAHSPPWPAAATRNRP